VYGFSSNCQYVCMNKQFKMVWLSILTILTVHRKSRSWFYDVHGARSWCYGSPALHVSTCYLVIDIISECWVSGVGVRVIAMFCNNNAILYNTQCSSCLNLHSVVETLLQLSYVWSHCHHTNRSYGPSPHWAEMGHSVGHIKDLRYPFVWWMNHTKQAISHAIPARVVHLSTMSRHNSEQAIQRATLHPIISQVLFTTVYIDQSG
jgi:hypothetical protein